MKKKRGKSTAIPVAAGEAEDRISELPDEILHKILWNISSSKQVAKTSVLSSRWQSLWGTYPDVEFDKAEYGGIHGSSRIAAAFLNFVDASIDKFALNSQLSMRTLDIRIDGDEVDEGEVMIRWSILDSAKSFFAKFPQFQTVNFRVLDDHKVTLFESDDPPKHPTTINHLKLHTSLTMKGDHEGVLEAMFWICRPKFLTLVSKPSISKEFFQILLNLKSSLNTSDEHRIKWQDQLKDVKIVKGDVDRVVKGRGEEMELMDVSKDMVTLLATEKQVCFLLTWC
ncbi:F-box/FBD/LRR-repeat protein At3g52680 [Linum perenne]